MYKWYQIFKFSVYKLFKLCHILKSNTRCCVLHVVLTCHIYTHIHIRARVHTYTHMHTHTRTHTHTHAHTDINFVIFWNDRKIKYTNIWDNAGPQNLIQGNSCFFMLLACIFIKKWTLSQDYFKGFT